VFQLGSQGIEPLSGSLLPPGRLLVAVQVGPVLSEDQPGRIAVGSELDRRERYGHHVLSHGKGRGVGDSLAIYAAPCDRSLCGDGLVGDGAIPSGDSGHEGQLADPAKPSSC